MATPTKKNIDAYKGNDLSIVWDFVDANDDSAININDVYDSVDFIIYKRNNEANPEIEYDLDSGLTVSSTNRLTATISDTDNDSLRNKFLYFKLTVTIGTTEKTFHTGNYTVYDGIKGAQTDSGFTLSIDDTTQVTEIQTSGLYAEALAELAKVSVPDTVILVDGNLTQNENPAFDNIDDAVTAAYAVIAGGASKCVIRAYANSSGVPYNLDDYDYYTLRDANIFFESPFDAWADFVDTGGDISNEDLVYQVVNENLNINVNNTPISYGELNDPNTVLTTQQEYQWFQFVLNGGDVNNNDDYSNLLLTNNELILNLTNV